MKLATCLMVLAALAVTGDARMADARMADARMADARRLSAGPAPAPEPLLWPMPPELENWLGQNECKAKCSVLFECSECPVEKREEFTYNYNKCISDCPRLSPPEVTQVCADEAKQLRDTFAAWMEHDCENTNDEKCGEKIMQEVNASKKDWLLSGVQDVCGLDKLWETASESNPEFASMICNMVQLFDISYHGLSFNLLSASTKFKDIGPAWCPGYVSE